MTSEERQARIREASQKYYSNGTSPLTDAEFDALIEEERRENPNSPLLGIGHGYDISLTSGQKIEHKYGTVGSLPKCHSWDEYPRSLKENRVCATLKLDGLSCAMYYRDGVMYQALTRGDGTIGIDITEKIHKIVPDYITIVDKSFTGAVRGEILMSLDKFEEYSATHEDAKNPRNTTAGLINAKEISEDLKYLTVVVYTVIGIQTLNTYPMPLYPFSDYVSMHEWLDQNFSNVVSMQTKTYYDADEFMSDMTAFKNTWYNKFPADGIVLTLNDISFVSKDTGAYIKYEASAFKFKAESAETTITGIEWNLSKTKYLVPTIQVAPVQLSGATVQRCSGFNAEMVRDNGWGVGAKVRMLRSGEVIPFIEETITRSEANLPTKCPVCNAELVFDGVHLKCPNPDCSDIHIQDLLVWCNNIAPTDGLGDTLKMKFFDTLREEAGIETSIEGIYENDLTIVPDIDDGVQFSLFCNMLNDLAHKPVSIVSALKALNIPRLGDATAELLSHYKEDIDQLIYGGVPDNLAYKIGNANAESIIAHKDKFKRLKFIYSNIQFQEEFSNNSRIRVAITGSLSVPRKQFEQILNENGFALGDINKDTKYLITDNPNSGSSKNAKADKLGIEKITEEDFRAKFNL